jgi:hypothetical protein
MIREIQELRARLDEARRAGGEPFRLIGSAELTVDPDDVLTASRAREAGLAIVRRQAAVFGSPRVTPAPPP